MPELSNVTSCSLQYHIPGTTSISSQTLSDWKSAFLRVAILPSEVQVWKWCIIAHAGFYIYWKGVSSSNFQIPPQNQVSNYACKRFWSRLHRKCFIDTSKYKRTGGLREHASQEKEPAELVVEGADEGAVLCLLSTNNDRQRWSAVLQRQLPTVDASLLCERQCQVLQRYHS